jgi:hypothetical protein
MDDGISLDILNLSYDVLVSIMSQAST